MRTPVITGIGVVSSIAIGREFYWDALSIGKCGIGEITLFDTSGFRGKLGAQVRGFDPDDYFERKDSRRLSRCNMLGVVALREAIQDSGIDLEALDKTRLAVVIGSGSGGLLQGEEFRRRIFQGRKRKPTLLTYFTASSFTDYIGLLTGACGFRSTISTACSSSSTAIGIAGEIVKKGIADVVITGGSESLAETTFAGFNSLRAVDEKACRPFDRDRKGISLGEGAAIYVVETAEHAAKRGKKSYAEIAGYGLSCDAYHVTAPSPDGTGIAHAIHLAMRSSGIEASEVGYINAHGTGTPANDLAETNAIKLAFRERAVQIPVSSTKSMIGHCLGAAGAKEAAAAILPFVRSIIPPTVHYRNPDPDCDLDYVPEPRRKNDISVVLSTSVAFGGNNTALILKRPA
ncbi:MAG: beta-ketoacyl-[acyl-carrier-protein] synthase family protein [Nitrospirae bacterium]|nr:beta-ketoacyl-[acyl-carrier-protein] synthase family protein [Nitrospirota bacterium]